MRTSALTRPAFCRFDYLARDALHCGVKISCDFDRIMRFSKVTRLDASNPSMRK